MLRRGAVLSAAPPSLSEEPKVRVSGYFEFFWRISLTSVPNGDLGLEAVDGFGVGKSELLVRVVLEEEILHQTRWAAHGVCHSSVGAGHGLDSLCFFLLGIE